METELEKLSMIIGFNRSDIAYWIGLYTSLSSFHRYCRRTQSFISTRTGVNIDDMRWWLKSSVQSTLSILTSFRLYISNWYPNFSTFDSSQMPLISVLGEWWLNWQYIIMAGELCNPCNWLKPLNLLRFWLIISWIFAYQQYPNFAWVQ